MDIPHALLPPDAPRPLAQAEVPPDALELQDLLSLRASGVPLAPIQLVPAAAEARFYALNTLPGRLLGLFGPVLERDPDEDEVEDLIPEAQSLIKAHFLLDEFIDQFYRVQEALPATLRLRRAGSPGLRAAKGRPALIALKDTWAEDWGFEAVLARLRATATVALGPRAVLLTPDDGPAPAPLADQVASLLGRTLPVFADAEGGVTRLVGQATPSRDARPVR